MKCGPLSRRQCEIAERIAAGLTNKEIAADLGVSRKTVEEHIRVAAERLPGRGYPRHRLTLFFLNVRAD